MRPQRHKVQKKTKSTSHVIAAMWVTVPSEAAMVEAFLGWFPFLQLARVAGMITGGRPAAHATARAHGFVPLPVPEFSPLRLIGHYVHLRIRAAWPLLAYDNSTRQPAGEPRRRVRIQHFRPLRAWPRTQATFPIPRGGFRFAISFFADPVLEAGREILDAQQAWQVVFRERFHADQVMELRTTAVQLQGDRLPDRVVRRGSRGLGCDLRR